jgi:hypothetical protein
VREGLVKRNWFYSKSVQAPTEDWGYDNVLRVHLFAKPYGGAYGWVEGFYVSEIVFNYEMDWQTHE